VIGFIGLPRSEVPVIRPTVNSDVDELISIATGTAAFKPFEIEVLRELLEDYLAKNEDGHVAVTLELGGKIVGFAYFAPTPMTDRCWHLYWIFVMKVNQARGLGSVLLKYVEDEILAAEGRLLLIETSGVASYEPTRQFYLKHGYEWAATIRDFYTDGDDQIIFRKRLH
jgi:GNAT superfamily N-acetyltransferase